MRWMLLVLALITGPIQASVEAIANITEDQTTIQRQDVMWMYTMKIRYWADGTRITVLNLPSHNRVHREFVRDVLGVSPLQYQQTIERQVNAGNAGTLRVIPSESRMVEAVRNIYGSVGYLSKDYLVISQGGTLRALRIID